MSKMRTKSKVKMFYSIFLKGMFAMGLSACSSIIPQENLPEYVTVSSHKEYNSILKTPAKDLNFPLSVDDKRDIKILEAKYDVEENCAGLAAPQIGIAKKIIVFAAEDSEELRKWRPDFTQYMPKTIWINPTYEGINQATHDDYEGCFSVKDIAGLVKRHQKIHYHAFTPEGKEVSGEAEGFLARIIQHEVDHVRGVLFVDIAYPDSIKSVEYYRKKRDEALVKK
jgi:peptide deformylase